jgi:hexokinase
MTNLKLKNIEKMFDISLQEMQKIVRDFHSEMSAGLAGENSSLKMIHSYVARPTGKERGKFIALDLGGTNFRILELELKGRGRIGPITSKSFTLDRKYLKGGGEELFDFLAECIKDFLVGKKNSGGKEIDLGFTFSFPVNQASIASGTLLRWTKGFMTEGVIGKDVVGLLKDALARKGLSNIKVSALANDTVGTLAARAYEDPSCDVGVIIGTGTNACYAGTLPEGEMIINIEWGNFNKLKTTSYDRMLDEASENKGSQILEKMVSGMYLGELCRSVICDLAEKNVIFKKGCPGVIKKRYSFKTDYMSDMARDRSRNMTKALKLFEKLGIKGSSPSDRKLCKDVCRIISRRASRVSAAALAAVITKTDPDLLRKHTVAIDGSVYEKYTHFSNDVKASLKELFGAKSSRIRIALVKDGSGKGAAIIAAVAGT